MMTLYQFPSIGGLPNTSPFCLKLETYLRMAELPYEIHFVMDPQKSPKGKLPCIKIEGQVIGDSELIIDLLKEKYGDVLDNDLSDEQRALATLLEANFADRLYWMMVYFNWQDEAGWQQVKRIFFEKLPSFSKLFVPNLVRKSMIKTLYLQGTGRHSREEILRMAYKSLDAAAIILGQNKFFLGSEIRSIDATAFGFLAIIVWMPHEHPLKSYLQKHVNILQYCDRIWSIFYPELTKPFSII